MEWKKYAKAAGIVALGVGFVGVGIHDITENPKVIIKNNTIVKEVFVDVPVTETVTETVEVEKIVNIENPLNLQLKEALQDSDMIRDAAINMLQDEIDEDIDSEYVLFEIEAKMEGENWIESNMVDLLNDEDYFDDDEVFEDYRKSEVSVKKIYDPIIEDRDFDDKDLVLSYEVKMKAKESGEDVQYETFVVEIPFEDGRMESDDVSIEIL